MIVQQTTDPEANIIVGAVINPDMGDDLVVTVIATGFEREELPTPMPVIIPRTARTGQQVMAGAGAQRGERVSELTSKEFEHPAYQRKSSDSRGSMERVAVVTDDEWDVPTFLRKQVD